jgi:hypothetical protein
VPYRDYYVEYPPGALPMFIAPALGDDGSYAQRFKFLALALGVVLVALVIAALAAAGVARTQQFAAAVLLGVAPAALGPVFFVNYDVWPALLTAGALAAVASGFGVVGCGLIACGVAAKIYPIAILPLALLHVRAAGRGAVAFGAVLAAIVLPFAILAPGAIANDVLNAARRPLQIESLGASMLLAAHQIGLYEPSLNNDYNSQNLSGALAGGVATGSAFIVLTALAVIVVIFARRPASAQTFFLAAAAAVAAVVAFGKILSPQFLIWLVPVVALSTSLTAYLLLLAALGLTQLWFPSRYGELTAFGDIAWVVLARNLVLVALFAVLLTRLVRGSAFR